MAELDEKSTALDLDDLISQAKPETLERLWVIEHFKVLPTDDRYTRLSEMQVSILLNHWLQSASEEDVKRSYWGQRQSQRMAPEDEQLVALGYSPEQIAAIKAELNG